MGKSRLQTVHCTKRDIIFTGFSAIVITSARRYCDPSCLLVRLFVGVFVSVLIR